MVDGLATGDLGQSLHVRDAAGGQNACRLVSDELLTGGSDLGVGVIDALGGEKVSQEEFRTCEVGFRYAETN